MQNGKGSKPRKNCNLKAFRENYDLIFKKNVSPKRNKNVS